MLKNNIDRYEEKLTFMVRECFRQDGCNLLEGLDPLIDERERRKKCANCSRNNDIDLKKIDVIDLVKVLLKDNGFVFNQDTLTLEVYKPEEPLIIVEETQEVSNGNSKAFDEFKGLGKAPQWSNYQGKNIVDLYYIKGFKKSEIALKAREHNNTVANIVNLGYYSKVNENYKTLANFKVIACIKAQGLLEDSRIKELLDKRGIDLEDSLVKEWVDKFYSKISED